MHFFGGEGKFPQEWLRVLLKSPGLYIVHCNTTHSPLDLAVLVVQLFSRV